MNYYVFFEPNGFIVAMQNVLGHYPTLDYLDVGPEPVDVLTHYVDQGKIVEMPPCPGDTYAFNYTTKQWYDMRSLEKLKLDKWEEIKLYRTSDMTAPLQTPFGSFDATTEAQKSITDSVMMLQTLAALGTPSNIDFTLANNSTVSLTTEQMVQVGLLLGVRTQQLYAKARLLRDQIDAASTREAVGLVSW